MRQPLSKIRLVLNLLMTIEVCFGIAMVVVTFYYQHFLSTFLTKMESEILSAKFFNTYVLGFQLIASYLCGMTLWSRIWQRRYSQNIQLLLSIWLFFCFLIIVCGFAIIWSLLTSADALAESAELMLYKGIDIYYINPEWKLLWDQLQYLKECCGVNNYQDWMYASWMPQNVKTSCSSSSEYDTTKCTDTDLEHNKNVALADRLKRQVEMSKGEQSLAPYACCKHESVSCYENYVPRSEESSSSIPHLNITDINTEGCLSLFTDYMWRLINLLCIIIFAAILVDVSDDTTAFQIIIICCLTKYLMRANECQDYGTVVSDMSMFDDEGNALVIIKCPPRVKCITLEEQNNSDSDFPVCCVSDNDRRRPCSMAKETHGQNKNCILH